MDKKKLCAGLLSFIVLWLFHPFLIFLFVTWMVYTHPFFNPILYLCSNQLDKFIQKPIPNTMINMNESSIDVSNRKPPQSIGEISNQEQTRLPPPPDQRCKHILKSGKQCLKFMVEGGMCKIHYLQTQK